MPDLDAEFFARLARLLDAGADVPTTIDEMTLQACEALACDYACITLKHPGGRLETVGATHELVVTADQWQYELGEGPCVEAVWGHESFLANDLASDERWPRWGGKAAELGLRSILSVRLFAQKRTYGALNLYGTRVRQYTPDDLETAQIFAAHAGLALFTALQQQNLEKAIDARHLTGQAQGILMERFAISADAAFNVLRRYSQQHNTKLRDVAQHLVEQRRIPSSPDAPVEAEDNEDRPSGVRRRKQAR